MEPHGVNIQMHTDNELGVAITFVVGVVSYVLLFCYAERIMEALIRMKEARLEKKRKKNVFLERLQKGRRGDDGSGFQI